MWLWVPAHEAAGKRVSSKFLLELRDTYLLTESGPAGSKICNFEERLVDTTRTRKSPGRCCDAHNRVDGLGPWLGEFGGEKKGIARKNMFQNISLAVYMCRRPSRQAKKARIKARLVWD